MAERGRMSLEGYSMRPAYRHLGRAPETSDLKISLYTFAVLLGLLILVLFFVGAWPASPAFAAALLVWTFTRKGSSPVRKSLHEAAMSVVIGTGLFCIAAVTAFCLSLSDANRQTLFEAEQWLLEARRYVHAVSGPNLTGYLVILGLLLVLLYFFPKSTGIGRILGAKKFLARVHLGLLAATSFTMFGSHRADVLAPEDHQRLLDQLKVSLRTELESTRTLLATQVAANAVTDALRNPEPQQVTRLIHLVEMVQGPAYLEIPIPRDIPRGLTREGLAHAFDLRYDYKREPVAGSSLRKGFIHGLLREVKDEAPKDQRAAAAPRDTATVETLARQLLGGVAETQAEWHRQYNVAEEADARRRQSEQSLKDVAKAVKEGMAAILSETFAFFTPHSRELAREWFTDLFDEAVVPLFEHRLEGRAESILKWSRDHLTKNPSAAEIPEELTREIRLSEAVEALVFPAFLIESRDSDAEVRVGSAQPSHLAGEIARRVETAQKEQGGGFQEPPTQTGARQKIERLRQEIERLKEEWNRGESSRREIEERIRGRERVRRIP
jgi:hypothetical protein